MANDTMTIENFVYAVLANLSEPCECFQAKTLQVAAAWLVAFWIASK